MKSSTNRALVAKKQSTSFAQVANNLLNLLQGYTKSIRLLLVMFLTLTVSANAWAEDATLSFASTTQRVSQTKTKQVWSNDGITFTNNKASSTNNVANYSNPVRLYQNSEVIVEHTSGKMTKIVFDCNSTSYATAMKNSIGSSATVSSDKVTVTFSEAVESFTVAKLTAQVRLDAITVTYEETCTNPNITTQPTGATYTKGETATALKVVASGTNLTYQWYSNTSNSTSGATKINNATDLTYTPSISTAGTKYYYCIVSSGSCSTPSDIVSVVVKNPPFTVTLKAGPGTCDASVTETSAGKGVTLPTPTLDCDGWTFAGWKITSAVTTETTTKPTLIAAGIYKPASNITLYAVYKRTEETEGTPTTENKTYTHTITSKTWDANGAKTLSNISWTLSNNGVYYGYDGTKGQQVGSSGSPAKSMTLTTSGFASATKITAVKISTSGASSISGNVSVKVGTTAYTSGGSTTKSLTSTNTQYEFTGSSTGNVTISWAQTSSKAIYFKKIEVDYQTTTGGGSSSTTYYHSTPDCGTPTPTPTLNVDPATLTFENTTTNTSGEKTFTLTGSNLTANASLQLSGIDPEMFSLSSNSVTQSAGGINQTITVTYTPTATGSHNATLTISSTGAESKTVTLSGTGVAPAPTYTVTFNANGHGTTPQEQTITSGGNASEPTAPTATGYTFGGWYTDKACSDDKKFDFNTPITEDIALYAKWTAETYTITLNANGGKFVKDGNESETIEIQYVYGTYVNYDQAKLISDYLAEEGIKLSREGYQLNEMWQSNGSAWKRVFTAIDRTIIAQWSKLYTITLSENGTTTEPTTQTSTTYKLPAELSAGSCQDDTKALVGWSTVAIPNPGDKPNSNFYELGETVTLTADQTTFYAVFATAEGSQNVFKRMQTLDELNNASKIAIINAYSSSAYILNTSLTSAATAPEESYGKITVTEGQYWTLEKSNSYWKFKNSDNKYLTTNTIPTSSSKSGSVQLSTSGNNEWVIANNTYTSNGTPVFTIYNASSKNAGLEYSNGWILYYSTDFNTSWFTLKLYIPDVSYSNYSTTCVKLPDPVWKGATIDKTALTVNCGERSPMTGANGAAKITFPTDKIYNFTSAITIEATSGFLVSTNQSVDANYKSSVSLRPLVGTVNANTFDDNVYVRAVAPAQSDTDLEGTITIKNNNGETLQTFSVTAVVTCTQYTLTLVDRGVSTEQPTKYYAGATINEAPADPEGVCTDPIHYVFDGWAAATVAEGSTTYTEVTFPYTVEGNTRFYAVYRYVEEGSAVSGDYEKVTSDLDDYSGDYLIVYEDGNVAFDGGRNNVDDELDATSNTIEVTINDNTIASNATTDAAKFTIAKVDGGYSIKSTSGYYIGWSTKDKNGLNANAKYNANYYLNTISNCIISGVKGTLKFNKTPGQERFRYYQSGQEAIALYRKAASYIYTTSPVCGPHVEITSDKDIYITSGFANGRNTVIAQKKITFAATRLKPSAGGAAPSIKVPAADITLNGSKTDKVKIVDITQNIVLQDDGITYAGTGEITVSYTPTASNIYEDINVQLRAEHNTGSDVSLDAFIVHARSLPSGFVIVAKSGDKWYALNGDMNINAANPANEQVTLDNNANPTKATYAPCNAIYTFDGLPNTGDRTYVRFQGTEGAWLWASSGTNVGIQNNVLKTTPEGSNKAYNWKLYTEDNITYRFGNANSSRQLTLSGEKFGMYASGVQDIRILPYEAKCLYNYAPTNLKVSVLKGTYVTLTWDAVAGATKYQYSTDATNWTDCGTEPTATINGLTGATKYTYYIRAYHEDAGVSQECIDYAEITFTTANCDDVPTNITYTADLNSITVSWTAEAPTATITYNTKEDGTGGGGTIENATSPRRISGGLNPNTTYYIQIFANGTCASPIIPVKTEDVEVDIVEWKTDGIVVDINTNENISVTLENEVSYGSGLGSLAEDLFFSKYFEGSGSLKMIAIYNGTGKDVDLTDYFIYKGHDGSANFDEDDQDKISYPLSELGVIKQGQEIVLYSWPLNTDAEASVYSCSQTFLHSIANESGQDANPRWILCGKDPTNSITPIYSDAMNFNGDDPLLLYKDAEIIDVFGATEGESPENNVICDGYNENGNYKTRSDESWVANDVSNMDYGKTAEDFPNGEIPDDVNVDDPTITAYTARVIMFRKNSVTSGANAVTKNTNDFHTFAEEWEVRQVCRISGDGDLTCAAYQELGTFDYSKYYTKFESMGNEQVFKGENRNQDGTITISIPELSKQSCRNIRIIIKDNNTKVISNQEYKVPIMITTTQGTAYSEETKKTSAFYALQENLATVEVDGNGNPTGDKTNLTLEQVREICKTCDVVVRDNATLTKVTDGTDNDHPQVRNIYVYENSSLIVPNGTNYTINNLSLRRNQDAVASLSAHPTALKLPESAAAPISLDFRLSAENWHWFTLPYNCNINEVKWIDGTPAQYNVDWFLMTYNGKKRAETQAGGCWEAYTGTTINAGDGFIIAINGNINNPAHTYELHFPMSKEVLTAEETDKTVAVRAWGVETNIRPNHKGWNLVGNPYLDYYQRNNITNFEGLRLGQLTGPDPQTGYWEQTGDVPYIVVPVGAGWIAYEQVLASETDLLPFTAYFVQVGNDGTHNSSQDLKVSFDHTKLQLSATPMPASIVRRAPSEVNETEEPVIVGVALTNSLGESDKTSLVIADRFTNEYEMQADFFKWFGDYYNYYTKPVLYTIGADQGKRAFNALNEELAKQPIPMGMYAAQAGNYTFSLNQQFDLSRVEEVWLYDATQSTYTNLMQSDYTFSTSKVNGAGRFSLSVKLAPKVATSIDNVTADKVWATTHTKQVIVNGLENGMHLWLYDATGKLLYTEPTSNYQHTYLVPQTGTYFVSVMKGNAKQTIKVVVE